MQIHQLTRVSDHRRMFAIALPMIISNIAAPLLGLVDTAIIGHLPEAIYLSSVAVGAMAINFIYLLAVFLRMATTGLMAQSFGAKDTAAQCRHFNHALIFALALGVLLIALQPLLLSSVWLLIDASDELQHYASQYIQIRLWGAPAALTTLVVLGVLLGRQQARSAMLLVILTNAVNVLLDVILIIGLDMNVRGAAWASVGAEWVTAGAGVYWTLRSLGLRLSTWPKVQWIEFKALFSLNRDILVRSLVLQLCMAMMTAYAVTFGDTTVAANAVLMQFLMLISLGLDGIAYAVEALIGQARGERRSDRMRHWFTMGLFWSTLFAIVYTLIFALFGLHIVRLITNIEPVIETASQYLPWLIALPLFAHWSYFFDGVYIGLSQSKAMRDSMLLAALCGFLPTWWLSRALENHGLWLALCVFMLARGVFQAWLLRRRRMLDLPAASSVASPGVSH